MDAGIWGFIGVVIGAGTSIVTTVMVARNTSSERSKEFQRNNFIELQDSLTVAMHLTMRIINIKLNIKLDDKEKELEKAGVKKDFMANNQNLFARTERIADESLRKSVRNLHTLMVGFPKIEIKDTNDKTFVNLNNQFSKVMFSVGAALRSNY
tara:strand:- start:41 stop:499 length:459 start_codon:yes stop_codon:yes gene_type:complete